MPGYRDALDGVIERVDRPGAAEVDRTGAFPGAGIEALGEAGLLGLTQRAGGRRRRRGAARGPPRWSSAWPAPAARRRWSCSCTTRRGAASRPTGRRRAPGDRRRGAPDDPRLLRGRLPQPLLGAAEHRDARRRPGRDGQRRVRLDAQKSWVTSAGRPTATSGRAGPLAADGPMTLWLVPADAPGLSQAGAFDGLGLRGNGSTPVTADGVLVPESALLGADGAGLDLALLGRAALVPRPERRLQRRADGGRHRRDGRPPRGHALRAPRQTLAQQPVRGWTSPACGWRPTAPRALLLDTLGALETGRRGRDAARARGQGGGRRGRARRSPTWP